MTYQQRRQAEIVVMGMDVRVGADLQPAVGASAIVKGISGERPFILYDGPTVAPRNDSPKGSQK